MLGVGFRREVLDFVKASETILSSVLIKPPLTPDERALIAEYVSFLSQSTEQWNDRMGK
jgi:hypothetical protein